MSLEAFGVKNLRCLRDTGLIPLKPMTVLVGKNSSGKSTFLRAFPLLRQSVEAARNSPILWGGDQQYVDFGSLAEAANSRLSEPSVTFRFRVSQVGEPPFDVAMTLRGGEVPFVGEYEIRGDGRVVTWTLDPEGRARELSVDGARVDVGEGLSLDGLTGLLPSLNRGENGKVKYHPLRSEDAGLHVDPGFGTGSHPLSKRSSRWLEMADFLVSSFATCVAYLAPLRVSAQRDYRIQNLAVDEVEPAGRNLAMFLHSLSPSEGESLAALTREALGFDVKVKTTGMRAEILVKGSSKRFANLVDVGFGYSQVLPLAAALWTCCVRDPNGRRPTSLLAMEQPELHLHPAHQAKLAPMLAGAMLASRKAGREVKLMIETHSEALVNGLGRLVRDGGIQAEDVQIVIFDQDEETEETEVRLAGYKEDGALYNWPYGFLAPVAVRLRDRVAAQRRGEL